MNKRGRQQDKTELICVISIHCPGHCNQLKPVDRNSSGQYELGNDMNVSMRLEGLFWWDW